MEVLRSRTEHRQYPLGVVSPIHRCLDWPHPDVPSYALGGAKKGSERVTETKRKEYTRRHRVLATHYASASRRARVTHLGNNSAQICK